MVRDRFAFYAQVLVCGAGVLAALASWGDGRRSHVGEYYSLLAVAGAGMLFFVQAGSVLTLFLGLEWFSIALYVLCALDTPARALARSGAQVPDRRLVRLLDPALRHRAGLRHATGELGFGAIREAPGADDPSSWSASR